MSNRLTIRYEAREDIREAAHWYNGQERGLGTEFLREVGACMSRVKDFPKAYPPVYKAAKRALLNRFPYAVYYTLRMTILSCLDVFIPAAIQADGRSEFRSVNHD